MVELSPQRLAEWCDTLGSVLPTSTRAGLRDLILKDGISGRRFAALVNQHELVSLDVPLLTQALATKVRKCWQRDFPGAASIRCVDSGHTVSTANLRQHQPGYGGSVPSSPPSRRVSSATLQRPVSVCQLPSTLNSASSDAAHSTPSRKVSKGPDNCNQQVELLRAALDCVAERAALDRQEMYLWVHSVMPNEIWQPLWDGVTADLLRQKNEQHPPSPDHLGSFAHTFHLGRSASTADTELRTSDSFADEGSPFSASSAPGAEESTAGRDRAADEFEVALQERCDGADVLAQPVVQKTEVDASCIPEEFDQGGQLTTHGQASEEQLETQATTTRRNLSWTANDAADLPKTPLEVAEWLRMLPSGKLADPVRKTIARHVLDSQISFDQFKELLEDGTGWTDLGIADARDGTTLMHILKAIESTEAGGLVDQFCRMEQQEQSEEFYQHATGMAGEDEGAQHLSSLEVAGGKAASIVVP